MNWLIHRWRRMKWGHDARLDCRECRWCGRFEVWAWSGWQVAERRKFEPILDAEAER